jgi:hypothetical protein
MRYWCQPFQSRLMRDRFGQRSRWHAARLSACQVRPPSVLVSGRICHTVSRAGVAGSEALAELIARQGIPAIEEDTE